MASTRRENFFGIELDFGNFAMLLVLAVLPNALGLLNIQTPYGVPIHFFQAGIFLSGFLYGPLGGLSSGIVGSIYSAILMKNPYIILFNGILGLVFGLASRNWNLPPLPAAALAFAAELPILFLIDYYLVHLPLKVITGIAIALAVSNILWATLLTAFGKIVRQSAL